MPTYFGTVDTSPTGGFTQGQHTRLRRKCLQNNHSRLYGTIAGTCPVAVTAQVVSQSWELPHRTGVIVTD